MDDEYVRYGVANIFIDVESLGGRRNVKITEHRARADWAHFIEELVEDRYPDAEKIVLVMDNLNTHDVASLYTAFPPEKLSVLKRQCLAGRIESIEKMRSETKAWNIDRNNRHSKIGWQFSAGVARRKIRRLYPKPWAVLSTRAASLED